MTSPTLVSNDNRGSLIVGRMTSAVGGGTKKEEIEREVLLLQY